MYMFFYSLAGIMISSVFASDEDDNKLKLLFGLSSGSIVLMISIIIYLCYRNVRRHRNQGHADLEILNP